MADTDARNSGMEFALEDRVHFRNRAGMKPIFVKNRDIAVYLPEGIFLRGNFVDALMYGFKVIPCFYEHPHDWQTCPWKHPGETAARRDLCQHNYSHARCRDMRRKGECAKGDGCKFAHNIFESMLHPLVFRTELCVNWDACDRIVCFFAHSKDELRPKTCTCDKCVRDAITGHPPVLPDAEVEDGPVYDQEKVDRAVWLMGGLGHLEHITVESVASFWFYWMGPGAAMKLAEPLGLYSAQIDGPPIARYAALIDALAGNPTLAPMIEAKIAMMADRARAARSRMAHSTEIALLGRELVELINAVPTQPVAPPLAPIAVQCESYIPTLYLEIVEPAPQMAAPLHQQANAQQNGGAIFEHLIMQLQPPGQSQPSLPAQQNGAVTEERQTTPQPPAAGPTELQAWQGARTTLAAVAGPQ